MNAYQYIFLQIKIMIYIYNVAVISINWISILTYLWFIVVIC